MKQELNQQKIWFAFKAGDQEAFARLYFAFYDSLYSYGLKLVGDEEFVKDVIQDFFVYLFEKRQTLADHLEHPTAYLLSSFRRRLLHQKRNPKLKFESIESQEEAMFHLFDIGAEDIMIKKESASLKKSLILKVLNELAPRQKEIIYLKYYHDMSTQEIADMLSISYQVVSNHLYRSLKKLRSHEISKTYALSKVWI